MPSPDTINIRDEDYPSANKPLPEDSLFAQKLHEHPPQGEDQLEVGSAGDAARPTKTGIMKPTLPPRGQMKEARKIARLVPRRRRLSLCGSGAATRERRGVALVAYFFFLAATFFFGALFLAGFDDFLAIVFPFLLRLCSPAEHVFRRRTSS